MYTYCLFFAAFMFAVCAVASFAYRSVPALTEAVRGSNQDASNFVKQYDLGIGGGCAAPLSPHLVPLQCEVLLIVFIVFDPRRPTLTSFLYFQCSRLPCVPAPGPCTCVSIEPLSTPYRGPYQGPLKTLSTSYRSPI